MSNSTDITQEDVKPKETRRMRLREKWARVSINNKLIVGLTAFIAGCTLVYVICALCQWRVMKGQLDQMREEAQLASRPWIGVNTVKFGQFEPGMPVKCDVRFTNTGMTPGFYVKGRSHIAIRNTGFDLARHAKLLEEAEHKNPTSLGSMTPNSGLTLPCQTDRPVTQEQINEISSGQCTVYAFGRLIYSDIFGIEHNTRYCYLWNPRVGKATVHNQYDSMD